MPVGSTSTAQRLTQVGPGLQLPLTVTPGALLPVTAATTCHTQSCAFGNRAGRRGQLARQPGRKFMQYTCYQILKKNIKESLFRGAHFEVEGGCQHGGRLEAATQACVHLQQYAVGF